MFSSQSGNSSQDLSRKRRIEQHSFESKRIKLGDGTSQIRSTERTIKQTIQSRMKKAIDEFCDTYNYAPLEEGHGQEIRVLVIEPGKGDDPINCRLVPSALPDTRKTTKNKTKAYPFIALSYYWGEGLPMHAVTITNYRSMKKPAKDLSREEAIMRNVAHIFQNGNRLRFCKTGTIHVRANLYAALQRLRDETEPTTVWIDALCIDQRQPEERSRQVKRMHELYIQAQKVSIWLGEGTADRAPDPKRCFKTLQSILDLKKFDMMLENLSNSSIKKLQLIVDLMHNKWFSRRWVIQELALARSAEVLYGKQTMPWLDFADAIAVFVKNYDKIGPRLKKAVGKKASYVPELSLFDGVTVLGPNTLVEFTNNVFRRGKNGEIKQRMQSLENLVSNLLAFEASDPRDTIYAVLSLAKDTQEELSDSRISPDYKHKSLLDVYVDFIHYCVEKSGSLDILLRYWAMGEKRQRNKQSESKTVELPTWIPLIHDSPWGKPDQRVRGRLNGDSFVGTSFRQSQACCYSASLNLKPDCIFGKVPSDSSRSREKSNGILQVKGIRIGTTKRYAPRAASGMIFLETLELAGFDHEWWQLEKQWSESEEGVPDEFWRTLVADRGLDGSNPPGWYRRACFESLHHLRDNGDLRPDDVLDLPAAPRTVKDFLERVKSVLWQRRFMEVALRRNSDSRESTTYGLAPPHSKAGDIICVLFGCSVPVVLRKQHNGDKTHYIMVGECYVYGMMDGEAVSGAAFNVESAEYFELR